MAARFSLPRQRMPFLAGLALAAAGLLLAALLPGAMVGWLGAAILFSAIPAGATYLVLMMRLIPGAWGEQLRLSAEAATLLTPWAALLFLPVVLGMGAIYPWMHGAKLTGMQQVMLNPAFFVLLTAARFAALPWLSGRMRNRVATRATSGGGLVLLPLLATLAAFVWLLSLDPKFTSSAFGLQFIEREFAMAFAALMLLRLSIGRVPPRIGIAGGVLLAILLVWSYVEFLSFFISWSGGLPDGAHWYLARGTGGWGVLLWVWAALSGVPLLALLVGRVRASATALRAIAGVVLLGKTCEMAWIALPGFGVPAILAFVCSVAGLALVAFAALPAALRARIAARSPLGARS